MKKILLKGVIFLAIILLKPSVTFAAEPIGYWTNTSSLPYYIGSTSSFTLDNKIFVLGGANTGVPAINLSANINSSGSLSTWDSYFPSLTKFWHSLVKKDRNIYILGGNDSSLSPTNSVILGTVDSSMLISFKDINSLPQKLSLGAAAIVGDKIYYAGGRTTGDVITNTIYWAQINSDGTIGSWNIAGYLPEALFGLGMVENGSDLIIIGGYSNSGPRNKTYKSKVNSDGSLGSWQETSSLPVPAYRSGVVRIGSRILSIAGYTGDSVYYTNINSDGTLGAWALSANKLPQPVGGTSVAVSNDYIYVAGGFNGNYLNTVYFAKINPETDSINLDVPPLKQTSPPWNSQVYDRANKWNPSDPSINAWGCAMTSSAMILKYYKINKLPSGAEIDPGTLNTWLNNQPDGYLGNGNLNWLAISRLSKLAKSINGITDFDALEFNRVKGDKSLLTNDIKNLQPDILEEPGHFIVAKGIQNDTFLINDPAYNRTSLNDGYSNSFVSMRRFIPSKTDLSYILITADPSLNIILKDNLGNSVGQTDIEQSITSFANETEKNDPIKVLYFQKPEIGDYSIEVNSDTSKTYSLKIYFYDKDGNVKIDTETGVISGETENISINFDKNNLDNVKSKKTTTFQSAIEDVKQLRELGEIKNEGIARAMIETLKLAEKTSVLNKKGTEITLKAFEKILNTTRGKLITEDAYQILSLDVSFLKKL